MCFTFMLHEGVVCRLDDEIPGRAFVLSPSLSSVRVVGTCCAELTIAFELGICEWNRVRRSCVVSSFMVSPQLNQPFIRRMPCE